MTLTIDIKKYQKLFKLPHPAPTVTSTAINKYIDIETKKETEVNYIIIHLS